MKKAIPITCLFVDIGGVLLSNGWDHPIRKRAAKHFSLNLAEMDDRHHLTFDTYEEGKLTLTGYLARVVFYRERPFTTSQFRTFMFEQSQPYPRMIELIRELKAKYRLKVVAVSNEGRELNAYRIRKFNLNQVVDCFVSSCFVHFRKPDADIFRLALDIAQVPVRQILYLENTAMFVQVAEGLGIRSILPANYTTTRGKLTSLGLHSNEGP